MIGKSTLRRWLASHPLTGRAALLAGILAVAIPTAIRASVDGHVSGVLVGAYVPFILVSAILLGWWNASLVALASTLVSDALFIGPPNQLFEGPEDLFVIGVFLVASGMIIGFVHFVRSLFSDRYRSGMNDDPTGIIFSLEGGQAWASRPGLGLPVRLGPQAEVAEMMRDFLAQVELGERLNGSGVLAAE